MESGLGFIPVAARFDRKLDVVFSHHGLEFQNTEKIGWNPLGQGKEAEARLKTSFL